MEIRVPKQSVTFTFDDGRSHDVPLLVAFEALQAIMKKHEGEKTFEYVTEFKTWWEANATATAGELKISRDEAYFLTDAIPVELDQQKKTQRAPLMSALSTE